MWYFDSSFEISPLFLVVLTEAPTPIIWPKLCRIVADEFASDCLLGLCNSETLKSTESVPCKWRREPASAGGGRAGGGLETGETSLRDINCEGRSVSRDLSRRASGS